MDPEISVRCCIAGGGPAGIMLGFLLARAGISVLVLEKHADFLRDFRGDTIHPSTLEIMHELGILDEFLRRPHQEIRDLTVEKGRVTGLLATTPGGEIRVKADLVVAADGRHSVLRERAGLDVVDLGAPMDVLWMRLSRRPGDPGQTLGRVDTGRIFVMLNRDDYWQRAFG